jgi:hypothetical protein
MEKSKSGLVVDIKVPVATLVSVQSKDPVITVAISEYLKNEHEFGVPAVLKCQYLRKVHSFCRSQQRSIILLKILSRLHRCRLSFMEILRVNIEDLKQGFSLLV